MKKETLKSVAHAAVIIALFWVSLCLLLTEAEPSVPNWIEVYAAEKLGAIVALLACVHLGVKWSYTDRWLIELREMVNHMKAAESHDC